MTHHGRRGAREPAPVRRPGIGGGNADHGSTARRRVSERSRPRTRSPKRPAGRKGRDAHTVARGSGQSTEPVRDDVAVVGAAALEAALADAPAVTSTPTVDIDVVVPVDSAADVVSHLEAADLRCSEVRMSAASPGVVVT